MKKVVIYGRVSSSLQEKEKTIESQMAELKDICKDFEVVKEYRDEGWSGGTLARPQLDELRDDASKGLFEAVYIHSPDRLARRYAYQIIVLDELKKRNIEVVFLNKAVSENPEDQLLLGVQGLIAEYEKAKILERTRRGRLHKAKTKGIVGGYASYGYDYVKKTADKDEHYAVNKKEAEIVNLIFDLYIQLKSTNAVVKELNKKKILPKRGGLRWSRSVIAKILRNESYIGIGYYNKYKSIEVENGRKYNKNLKTGRQKRDKSEWIPTPYPTIIDKNKFDLVQKILSKHFKPFAHTKYFYLLSGLIRCAKCGSTFTGEAKRNQRFWYYRCNHRHKRYPLPDTCNAPVVRTGDVDTPVWEAVKEAITHPDILKKHISFLSDSIEKKSSFLEQKRDNLIKKQQEISQKRNRLIEIYTDGGINKEQFAEKNTTYNAEEETIKRDLMEIEESLKMVAVKPMVMKILNVACDKLKERILNANQNDKRDFLRDIIEKISLNSWTREANIVGYIDIDQHQLAPVMPTTNPEDLRTKGGTLPMLWNPFASQLKKEASLCPELKILLLFQVSLCWWQLPTPVLADISTIQKKAALALLLKSLCTEESFRVL